MIGMSLGMIGWTRFSMRFSIMGWLSFRCSDARKSMGIGEGIIRIGSVCLTKMDGWVTGWVCAPFDSVNHWFLEGFYKILISYILHVSILCFDDNGFGKWFMDVYEVSIFRCSFKINRLTENLKCYFNQICLHQRGKYLWATCGVRHF